MEYSVARSVGVLRRRTEDRSLASNEMLLRDAREVFNSAKIKEKDEKELGPG